MDGGRGCKKRDNPGSAIDKELKLSSEAMRELRAMRHQDARQQMVGALQAHR